MITDIEGLLKKLDIKKSKDMFAYNHKNKVNNPNDVPTKDKS